MKSIAIQIIIIVIYQSRTATLVFATSSGNLKGF
jgi:hypothetical protein